MKLQYHKILYAIGAAIIALLFFLAFMTEADRLDLIHVQQKEGLKVINTDFKQAIKEINEKKDQGLITDKEASRLLQKAYEESLVKNQELLIKTMGDIVEDLNFTEKFDENGNPIDLKE
ncbi:MAG TPA: hypothetical protein VIN02_06675 [Sulfurovum sp.]